MTFGPLAPEWTERVACTDPDVDKAIFFPKPRQSAAPARAVCRRCDVRQLCLDYVLDLEGTVSRNSRWGIYAGLTPEQRAKLAGKRKR